MKYGVKCSMNWTSFWNSTYYILAAMERYPRMNCLAYNDGRSRKVCTFVAPYGYVNETVSETTVAQYADYFKDNEMTCLFFDCTPEGSEQLLASGSASKGISCVCAGKKRNQIAGKSSHIQESAFS